MNVLYYLEPWVELDRPLFRLGTIRNHLRHEMNCLLKAGHAVGIVLGEAVANEAERESLIPEGVSLYTIKQADLLKVFPSYFPASLSLFRGESTQQQLRQFDEILSPVIGDFKPSVMVCYESASDTTLRLLYKDIPILSSTLGIFSRPPYPETFCLDPVGIFSNSWLAKFGKEKFSSLHVGEKERVFCDNLRQKYFNGIIESSNPFQKDKLCKGFEKTVLLPLQVSNYFAFDACLPEGISFSSQFDFLCWVLSQVPSDIGVLVTEHPAQPVINKGNYAWLKKNFPNLIYDYKFRDTAWVSQYLMSVVDGVITVSSSLGLQAFFLNKPLCVIGKSHLNPLATTTEIQEFTSSFLDINLVNDDKIYYLLNHYYPLTKSYLYEGGYLERCLENTIQYQASRPNTEALLEIDNKQERLLERLLVPGSSGTNGLNKAGREVTHYRPSSVKSVTKKKIRKEIDRAKCISFDIFDTLLVRDYSSPDDLLRESSTRATDYLWRNVHHDINSEEYYELRKRTARNLLEQAKNNDQEDITLRDIYNGMRKTLGVSKEVAVKLRKIESDLEIRHTKLRGSISQLYEYARARNKEIILTSDMYLDSDIVDLMLRKNNIQGYEKLYLSSELKLLKKTGNLFKHILSDRGIRSSNLLHIGDNAVSDYSIPKKLGIRSILIPKSIESMYANPYYHRAWKRIGNNPGSMHWISTWQGLVSNRLFGTSNISRSSKSLFSGSAINLGYAAGGPIIAGFVAWLIRELVRDKVDRVYFLARDGWYPKTAYDVFTQNLVNAPEAHYLLASRRGCIIPSLKNWDDIESTLEMGFSPVEASVILQDRFGLDSALLAQEDWEDAGFSSGHDLVTSKNADDIARLTKLLKKKEAAVLKNAEHERDAYVKYLTDEGVFKEGRIAIVDIGHNGTLQLALSKLTGVEIGGYYFSTFEGALKLVNNNLPVKSYLLSFEDHINSEHFYCKNIGMFEFLFIPDKPSFQRIRLAKRSEEEGSEALEEFVEGDESVRRNVASQIESGINDFINDIWGILREDAWREVIEPEATMALYRDFIETPCTEDINIVKDVSFVDAYGGSKERYLIHPEIFLAPKVKKHLYISMSWWRAGAETLLGSSASSNVIIRSKGIRLLEKFLTKPYAFFADGKSAWKRLFRHLYGNHILGRILELITISVGKVYFRIKY